jgi:hypothetical protein
MTSRFLGRVIAAVSLAVQEVRTQRVVTLTVYAV